MDSTECAVAWILSMAVGPERRQHPRLPAPRARAAPAHLAGEVTARTRRVPADVASKGLVALLVVGRAEPVVDIADEAEERPARRPVPGIRGAGGAFGGRV